MEKLFQLCSFVYLLTTSLAQIVSDVNQHGGNLNDGQMPSQLALYRSVFKQKRLEQMMAVENIIKMNNYEKQYKIINMIFERLFKTVQDAKTDVTTGGYVPGEEFPPEQKQKEAIGKIVENTALLGDVVLRLPDISHKIFSKNKEWELLTLWSLSFTNSTTIYDEVDSKLLNLMAQELKLIPRDPNYFNPFTEKAKHKRDQSDKDKVPNASKHDNKSHKKKKKARGPRLSHTEL